MLLRQQEPGGNQGQGAAAEAASTRLKLCVLSAEQLTFMQYILKSSLRYSGGSGASWLPLAACSLTSVASFCAFCGQHTSLCKGLNQNHRKLLGLAGAMPQFMYCWVMQFRVLPRSCNWQPAQAGAAIFRGDVPGSPQLPQHRSLGSSRPVHCCYRLQSDESCPSEHATE